MEIIKNANPAWATQSAKVGRPKKYPFSEMEVGDMFRVPIHPSRPLLSSFRVMTSARGTEQGKRFRVRVAEDGAFEVVRVE